MQNAKSSKSNGVQGGIIGHKTAYVARESTNAIHNGGYIQPYPMQGTNSWL